MGNPHPPPPPSVHNATGSFQTGAAMGGDGMDGRAQGNGHPGMGPIGPPGAGGGYQNSYARGDAQQGGLQTGGEQVQSSPARLKFILNFSSRCIIQSATLPMSVH